MSTLVKSEYRTVQALELVEDLSGGERTQKIREVTEQIASFISELSSNFVTSPTSQSEALLERVVRSPEHTRLLALDHSSEIIGVAALSTVLGIGERPTADVNPAYDGEMNIHTVLEDFVVAPKYQGIGVSHVLWDSMIDWSVGQEASALLFESKMRMKPAHAFYLGKGCVSPDVWLGEEDQLIYPSPEVDTLHFSKDLRGL